MKKRNVDSHEESTNNCLRTDVSLYSLSLSPQIKQTFPKTNEYSPNRIANDSVVIMAAVVTSCVCNHVFTV